MAGIQFSRFWKWIYNKSFNGSTSFPGLAEEALGARLSMAETSVGNNQEVLKRWTINPARFANSTMGFKIMATWILICIFVKSIWGNKIKVWPLFSSHVGPCFILTLRLQYHWKPNNFLRHFWFDYYNNKTY